MARGKAKADELTFRGSIAPLQTAISFGADGGARIKIDVPQSDRIAAAALIEVQGCELEFTVKVVKSDGGNETPAQPVKRSAAKLRK